MEGKEEQKERMAESELLLREDCDQEIPTETFSLCCFFVKLYIFLNKVLVYSMKPFSNRLMTSCFVPWHDFTQPLHKVQGPCVYLERLYKAFLFFF